MLDYLHRPAVAEHLVLLRFAALPLGPFGDGLQSGAFGWSETADSWFGRND